MALGIVYGTDGIGNCKVRPQYRGIPTNKFRPTVLRRSYDKGFKLGDRVNFQVCEAGVSVDFSEKYWKSGVARNNKRPNQKAIKVPEGLVNTVLVDIPSGDMLIVGEFGARIPVPYEQIGRICDRDYALTNRQMVEIRNEEILARLLGINPSALVYDMFPSSSERSALRLAGYEGHPERLMVEEAIRARLTPAASA